MKPRIYVVEDDSALQELYTYTLETEFCCQCFCDGKTFFERIAKEKPDIILLDVMLPSDDGFSILSRLKSEKATSQIPVIMVSAKGDEISKVKGLNMGADDYIAKPFGILELVARIKASLRKNIKEAPKNVSYKDIEIDNVKRNITVNGSGVQTTLKEYNLLSFLCERAESVQERDVIFKEIWGEDFIGETRTLDIHIKELRRKLLEAGSEASIKTIRGVGYMMI